MRVDRRKVEAAFRTHYAVTKDDTEAWNLTLEELAGPYGPQDPEEVYERRMKISNMLRDIAKKVRVEEGVEADIDWHEVVRRDVDLDGLVNELKAAPWRFVEKNRIERTVFVASWDAILGTIKDEIPESVYSAAEEDDTVPELENDESDAYMEALAEEVATAMKASPGKPPEGLFDEPPHEYKKEHVFATFEDGDGFIGQYEEGGPEKLEDWVEARGEEIED